MSFLNDLFARARHRQLRSTRPRTRLSQRMLRVEMLEDRRVLATLVVDDGGDCSNATFTSIQAAVTAAAANDKIVVCPGTYTEQIIIPATKNGLEIESKKPLKAIIKAPGGSVTPAIIHVDGAKDVEIEGFTITGPMFMGDGLLHTGIFVGNGGSAEIEENHITKIREEPFGSTPNGIAILVGRGSTLETGSAEIEDNKIDDYQKGGIVIDWLGSDAEIEDNEIKGHGPTSLVAQNGIQISRGATAEVEDNEVSGNEYTIPGTAGTGILLFESGETEVEDNEVSKNDVGIDVVNVTAKTEIEDNDVSRNTDYGIRLTNSINAEIEHNKVTRSGMSGIYLSSGSNGNKVSDNESTKNGLDGIQVENSNGNKVKDNESKDNDRDGIRVTGISSGNEFKSNEAKNNDEHDFHDDTIGALTAGTASLWKDNEGKTENRVGLRKK